MTRLHAKWCKPLCYVLVPAFVLFHIYKLLTEDFMMFTRDGTQRYDVLSLVCQWVIPMLIGCILGLFLIFLVQFIQRQSQIKRIKQDQLNQE
ncbi:MAG: hypothetical protein KGZ84_04315 [Erysipelotrichia bacterium]|nr:hypothetical protein [Erysipelotrichia bacterium]